MDKDHLDELIKKGLQHSGPDIELEGLLPSKPLAKNIFYLVPLFVAIIGFGVTFFGTGKGLQFAFTQYFDFSIDPILMLSLWSVLFFLSLDFYVKRFR